MSNESPERYFFRSLARHRLLWPFVIAGALFLIAVAARVSHWAGWWP